MSHHKMGKHDRGQELVVSRPFEWLLNWNEGNLDGDVNTDLNLDKMKEDKDDTTFQQLTWRVFTFLRRCTSEETVPVMS